MANAESYAFRDARSLVKWTRWSVYARLVTVGLALISGSLEYNLLTDMRDGNFESVPAMLRAAEANDARQAMLAILDYAAIAVSAVLTLRWIYRANQNARALGASGLDYTPGWAVGWFFVPLMNLWKPMHGMQQLWQASADPVNWRQQQTSRLLGLWWLSWLLIFVLGRVSRLRVPGDEIDPAITLSIVGLISNLCVIVMCVAFLIIMQSIEEMQARTASARAQMPPAMADELVV